MKELKTLKEHNKAILRYCNDFKNGIACPQCGEELIDSEPNIQLCSMSPQTRVKCYKCGYEGLRLV